MEREIKFRCWDKTTSSFVPFEMNERGMIYSLPQSDCDVVLMQYTGLKDKNGKEIYEGDIVALLGLEDKPRKVEFLNSRWCFTRFDFVIEMSNTRPKEIEVTGNIYQHPELLTP